jgi:phosphoribosylformylglycinamidine cyclo-ligase
MSSRPLTYADAGVDLTAWAETKARIGRLVKSTYNAAVVGSFGQFGGLFDISALKELERPILVSSVDGVGTKLKIAFEMGIHDTVGEDIVNHCIDDILVLGARPLYFLDYLGTGKLSPEVAEQIVAGLARACRQAGIPLIAGETAEMPGFYTAGEYDLAGTIVGVVDGAKVVDGSGIVPGDVVLGLRSNGLHTNGYSLARKIITEVAGKSYTERFEEAGMSFGEELLRPHRPYTPVWNLLQGGLVKGCAHITGGGFPDNVDRILPQGCDALIDTNTWEPDPIFCFLHKTGGVERAEMYRTFNMGIGMVLVVAAAEVEKVKGAGELAEFDPRVIGEIRAGEGKVVLEW